MEPRGQDLIKRYKANYEIPIDCVITEKMILKHWDLEKRLREELLRSTHDNRWKIFERCYNKLYGELGWLTQLSHAKINASPSVVYGNWMDVIGPPPMKVYEIGSGKGELIYHLATCGFECRATEITYERGEKWVSMHPNLSWGVSDGVHLDQFEPTNFYDVVISNNVIEHLHPDDLLDHFRGVFSILSINGRYVFSTPHVNVGPSDISRVFQCDKPMGMHLKEYSYSEIAQSLRQVGFKYVNSILRPPMKFRRLFGKILQSKASNSYMAYLCVVERLISRLPSQKLRRKVSNASKLILFASNIMVVAKKL